MIRLTREEIFIIHEQLIERYGGLHGVRDENILDLTLNAPYQTFGEIELYPGVIEKATRLCFGLVKNHPFYDGNKRIGAMALLATLNLNNFSVDTNSAELTEIILSLAAGSIDYDFFLQWVKDRII